jgi:nucleoside-diphosphate-sugar epimerase
MALTILGGHGFIGRQYVADHYDAAIGNIASINTRDDYEVHSKDVLYLISTVDNYNVFTAPTLDINTNLLTLISVLENWRLSGNCGVFNFISSWFVYGDTDCPYGAKETSLCNPKGFYSITKRCAEQLLISYCETFGLKYRILRLGNVVGPGKDKVSEKKNALQYMVNLLKDNKEVRVYGTGLTFRDYIHVKDCSRAIELILCKGEVNSVYNVGNGQTWPLLHILKFAKEKLNSNSVITLIEPKEFHKKVQIESFFMNSTKLFELGYTPEFTGEKLFGSLCEF